MRAEANRWGAGSREAGGNQVAETTRKAGASQVESKGGKQSDASRGLAQGESKRKSRSIFGNLTGTKQMEQPRRNAA